MQAAQVRGVVDGGDRLPQACGHLRKANFQSFQDAFLDSFLAAFLAAFLETFLEALLAELFGE